MRSIVRMSAVAAVAALAFSPSLALPGDEAGHYAPYAFLVGTWDVGPPGGPPMLVARVMWGPGRAYLWYAVSMLDGGAEHPHLEGMMMWNGVRRDLDVLFTLDLDGGHVQEKGVATVRADGTVVREVTASYSEGSRMPPRFDAPVGRGGATARFRQTWRAAGPDTIRTSVLRETKDGWVATFPGTDDLVMTRRAEAAK
jgi:hypothetical protein